MHLRNIASVVSGEVFCRIYPQSKLSSCGGSYGIGDLPSRFALSRKGVLNVRTLDLDFLS
jgi:hypothetical protein